jgi:aminopeptidase N
MSAAEITVPLPSHPPTPALVYANANDQAYALVDLDTMSIQWLSTHISQIHDPFLRAMTWGSLWDRVRNAKLAPTQFLSIAYDALPQEHDEESAIAILGHVVRSVNAYLSTSQRDSLLPSFELMLQRGVKDTTFGYGLRKANLNALLAIARTPAMQSYLDGLLDSTMVAGQPLRAPTCWSIVTYLLARDAPSAEQRFATEVHNDSTSDGRHRAFIAQAAKPHSAVKQHYFDRYFNDSTLNEDWVMGSLGTFNTIDAQSLTLPFLHPALDTLAWLQQHRRIFFLSAWLNAFLHGQTTVAAQQAVNNFLKAHPQLPADLRQKVLQAKDELDRTVAIRRKFASGDIARE